MRLLHWSLLGIQLQLQAAAGFPSAPLATAEDGMLLRRQFGDIPPDVFVDDNCRALCTAETCFAGVCPANVLRRDPLSSRLDVVDDYNNTTSVHRLSKRVFSIPVNNAGEAIAYVKRQFEIPGAQPVDGQFGADTGYFITHDDEKTVSHQAQFVPGQTIQWGTGGLHGCTMMLLVSNRGAWMAHFWEKNAFCASDSFVTDPNTMEDCGARWREEVVRVIDSDRPGVSVAINWDLFNRDDDNTMLLFMTPARDGGVRRKRALYPKKIAAIQKLVESHVPGVYVEPKYYAALDYRPWETGPLVPGTDRWRAAFTERGHALFQYDGAGGWRVFWEDWQTHS